jgi:hypothetical protein
LPDPQLVARYGASIPVIAIHPARSSLAFNADDVSRSCQRLSRAEYTPGVGAVHPDVFDCLSAPSV